MTFTEQHKETLQQAIRQMPSYNPPAALWDDIADALDAEENLVAAARRLGTHQPPTAIWAQIEQELDQSQQLGVAPPMRANVNRKLQRWMAAAAVTVGVAVASWWLLQLSQQSGSEQIIVKQEVLDTKMIEVVRDADTGEGEAFAMIEEMCASRAPVCDRPDFKALKTSLEELTSAKENLRSALGQYGDDPQLVEQLVRIERERSQLLQEMISLI